MGRKKGKQCGGFTSKALRAAYSTELKKNICEAKNNFSHRENNNCYENHHYGHRSVDSTKRSSHDISAYRSSDQFGRRNTSRVVNHLRGLLMDRRMEDLSQDREIRLRRQTERKSTNHLKTDNTITMSSDQRSKFAGWIHYYKDVEEIKRENMLKWSKKRFSKSAKGGKKIFATYPIHLRNQTDTEAPHSSSFPSLQSLCIKVLAPSLPQYIEQLGPSTVHSVLATLSSQTLTSLSVLVSCTTREIVRVIGNHSHLDRLTLQCGSFKGGNEIDSQDSIEKAILDLVPKVSNEKEQDEMKEHVLNLNQTKISINQHNQDQDQSWEDMLDNQNYDDTYYFHKLSTDGCFNLTRFEIIGATNISSAAIFTFLQKCSKIIHLSLQSSLKRHTGIDVLFHPKKGILGYDTHFFKIGQVLDLSFCDWLTDEILIQFLERIKFLSSDVKAKQGLCDESHDWDSYRSEDETGVGHDTFIPSSSPEESIHLQIIRVFGCQHLNYEKCQMVCTNILGKSILSVEDEVR